MRTSDSMPPLIVFSTDKTPAISFIHENSFFKISGAATSPKAKDIFLNAANWLKKYGKFLEGLIVSRKIHSGQLILKVEIDLQQTDPIAETGIRLILAKFHDISKRYARVKVRWHYNSRNEKQRSFLENCLDSYSVFFELVNETGVPSLFIHPTDTTPKIFFDSSNGVFRISGSSLPEHTFLFYNMIACWIEENGKWLKRSPLEIKMRYFNTSSAKELIEILKRVNNLYKAHEKGNINWNYLDEGELEEAQNDFEKNFDNLSFNYIQRKLIATNVKQYIRSEYSRQ